MRFISMFIFLLIASTASAENWICYDAKKHPSVLQGDCTKLGICTGPNHDGLQANCFEATKDELDKARGDFVKYDPSIIEGNRIVDFTKQEKDAQIAKRVKDEKDAKDAQVDSLNISNQDLIQALIDMGIVDAQTLKDAVKNLNP